MLGLDIEQDVQEATGSNTNVTHAEEYSKWPGFYDINTYF